MSMPIEGNAKLNSSRGVAPLRVKDELITDDVKKAAVLNDYFTTSFTAPTHPVTSVVSAAVDLNDRPIVFSEFVTCKALRSAKHTCSAGPDSIPSVFWAKLASSLALPISILLVPLIPLVFCLLTGKLLLYNPCLKRMIPV
jgi:hypothetical protein